MELEFSPELQAFRAALRKFIGENQPEVERRPGSRAPRSEDLPALRSWWSALFREGYLGADWPAEWGGRDDHSPLREYILDEELGLAGAPTPVGAWRLVASALFAYGTEAQRHRFLPKMRTAEHFWCQLFSEPDAGSDLASLRTRAVLDGSSWVVNGQKVWTTHGHLADYGFLLARTDPEVPKHAGITAMMVDMKSPGIDVRPLRELTGAADFNEVFLTNVRVPVDNVLGDPGEGWAITRMALARERMESRREDPVTAAVRRLAGTVRASLSVRVDDEGAWAERLGFLHARAAISDLLGYSQVEKALVGRAEADDASITKVFFTELNLDVQRSALDAQGARGVLSEDDPDCLERGRWQEGWLWARGFTISAGSNEIMRNIVAERGLGMPRDRSDGGRR